jgi:hypothetical protein
MHCSRTSLRRPDKRLVGQVLVAAGDSVILVDADSASDQGVTAGPITRMAVAPNGQFLAGFTAEGKLVVWTADFGKFLSEFATQSDEPPVQLAWCGTDSVVLYWEVSDRVVTPPASFRVWNMGHWCGTPFMLMSSTLLLHFRDIRAFLLCFGISGKYSLSQQFTPVQV